VLAFAGAKMLAAPWVKISPIASVAVIGLVIGVAAGASVWVARRDRRRGRNAASA